MSELVEENAIRECLDSIPTYIPGKPAPESAFKVSSNESPFEPLPQIQQALIEYISSLNRYPDMAATNLREALAEKHGVEVENIHVSTGASAVLSDLVRATVNQGEEVIYPWRSFEAYPIIIQSHGGIPVPIALQADATHDLTEMLNAINEHTRLILLCSPNNPTGTTLGHQELDDFLAAVPERVTVGLDEAYIEFAKEDSAPDSAQLFGKYPNLVITRTFSKVHSIAGLRLGYAVAHPRLAQALIKVTVPFGASALAQAAALAALEKDAAEALSKRVEWLKSERGRIVETLKTEVQAIKSGEFQLPDSQGNFLYLPLGNGTPEFVEFARKQGLIVRGYATDGVRITVAEEAANDRTIAVIKAWFEQ